MKQKTQNTIVAIIFGTLSSLLAAAIQWIISQDWASTLLMPVAVVVALGLGWFLHFMQTARLRRVDIGHFDSELDFLDESSQIDMIAITFAGFTNYKRHVLAAIRKKNAHVRILLLEPNCAAFTERANLPCERGLEGVRQDSQRAVELINQIRKEIESENAGRPEHIRIRGSVEHRFYGTTPLRGAIVTNDTVKYWPYLAYFHPTEALTYYAHRGSPLGERLAKEFEELWKNCGRNRPQQEVSEQG